MENDMEPDCSSQNLTGIPGGDRPFLEDVSLYWGISPQRSEESNQDNMDDNDELANKIKSIGDDEMINTPEPKVFEDFEDPYFSEDSFTSHIGNESSSNELKLPMNNICNQDKMTICNSAKLLDYPEYNANSPEFVQDISSNNLTNITTENLNRNMAEILGSNIHDHCNQTRQINTYNLPQDIESSKINNNTVMPLIEEKKFINFSLPVNHYSIDNLTSQVLNSGGEQDNILEVSSRFTQNSEDSSQDLVNSFLIWKTEETKDIKNISNNNNHNIIKKLPNSTISNKPVDNLRIQNLKLKKFKIHINSNKCINNESNISKNDNSGKIVITFGNEEFRVKNKTWENNIQMNETLSTSTLANTDVSIPSTSTQQISVPAFESVNSLASRVKRKIKTPIKLKEETVTFTSDEEEEEELNHPPRKRGRDSLKGLTPAEKYHRIREQNNAASKKCREKKKQEKLERERELQALQKINQNLKNRETKLNRKLAEWRRILTNLENK